MRILIVKLSSLGDVVHTLPAVHDILTGMPEAQIDWVVEKAFAPLLTQVNGLRRIIPCELRRWRKSFWSAQTRLGWRAFKTDLQTDTYDAVIDLQGLTKSAVVARLARLTARGKRYAMANQTDGSAYEAPTRWLADVQIAVAPHSHAVARGRQLVASALQYTAELAHIPLDYALNMPVAHMNRAQAAPKSIAFIHGTSRPDKQWPLQNWVELGQRFAAQGYRIVLVHGSSLEQATSQAIAVQLASHSAVLPLLALDALTIELGGCVGAIGVDSGVSHIAVALGLPHVQIYNFDTAWRTGPLRCGLNEVGPPSSGPPTASPPTSTPLSLGHQVSVFAQPHPSVDAVWQAWLQAQGALP